MMVNANSRTWRFNHPDFDTGTLSVGLQLNHAGSVAMVDGAMAVRQSILLLLSTMPGERIMRPEYGCNLHRLVFEPNDATTAGLAIHYVREAIERWEPRAEILHLDAEPAAANPNCLEIVLEFRARTVHVTDRIVFPVNLVEQSPP